MDTVADRERGRPEEVAVLSAGQEAGEGQGLRIEGGAEARVAVLGQGFPVGGKGLGGQVPTSCGGNSRATHQQRLMPQISRLLS